MSFWESAEQEAVRLTNNLIRQRMNYLMASNSLALARKERSYVGWWEREVKNWLDAIWRAQNALAPRQSSTLSSQDQPMTKGE